MKWFYGLQLSDEAAYLISKHLRGDATVKDYMEIKRTLRDEFFYFKKLSRDDMSIEKKQQYMQNAEKLKEFENEVDLRIKGSITTEEYAELKNIDKMRDDLLAPYLDAGVLSDMLDGKITTKNLYDDLKKLCRPVLLQRMLDCEKMRNAIIKYELNGLDATNPEVVLKVLNSDFGREVLPIQLRDSLLDGLAKVYTAQLRLFETKENLVRLYEQKLILDKQINKYKICGAVVVSILIFKVLDIFLF